jgi:hypothetical protein
MVVGRLVIMTADDRQSLRRKVREAFPDPEIAKAALASLDRYKGYGGEGLKLAAIKASGGELWKLRELLRAAKKDFRDVFLEADEPEKVRRIREQRRADPALFWGRLQRPSTKRRPQNLP